MTRSTVLIPLNGSPPQKQGGKHNEYPIATIGANNSIVCHIELLTAEQLLELIQLRFFLGEILRF